MVDAFWTNLTEAQAVLMTGILTLLAALAAVALGSKLFQGKVTSLQDSIRQASQDVEGHIRTLTEAMKEIEESALVTSERVAEISGREPTTEAPAPTAPENETTTSSDHLNRIRSAWEIVRETIEAQASDHAIDGRRRAKYSRLDRRNYTTLVDAMARDGEIRGPSNLAAEWKTAIEMRQSFRNGKRKPTEAIAKEMERIARLL